MHPKKGFKLLPDQDTCAANFLFFGLPYASDHNSDKSRDHSIGVSNSSSVNRFQ